MLVAKPRLLPGDTFVISLVHTRVWIGLVANELRLVENRLSNGGEASTPQLTRITRDPTVMGGKPCIRGMRVKVGTVVG
jgi:hypothetical protein